MPELLRVTILVSKSSYWPYHSLSLRRQTMKKLYPSFANPINWRTKTLEEHSQEYKDQWRKLRSTILERDNYLCQYCGFRAEKWQIVHHIDGNPSNNSDCNLETICPMCNLVHHAGQGCIVQGVVDLYKEAKYSQREIIRITREMRSRNESDGVIIHHLGLRGKVPFEMNKTSLKKLFAFVTSRRAKTDWTQNSLEYGYRHFIRQAPPLKQHSLSKFC